MHVNWENAPVNGNSSSYWIKQQNLVICSFKETYLLKGYKKFKKDKTKICLTIVTKEKLCCVAISILCKIYFGGKNYPRE